MDASRDTIIGMFQSSIFALTFESEDILGYRSHTDTLRAFTVDLRTLTIEYEVTQEGKPTKRHIEYSPGMAQLIKKLPLTADAFDLKFQGLRLASCGVSVTGSRDRLPCAAAHDPWDTSNYFDETPIQRPRQKSYFRLAEEKVE